MDVIFSDQPVVVRHPSIFLAGPTPRSSDISSWRPEALDLLRGLGFASTVLVPERRDWSVTFDYLDQVDWEYAGQEGCSVIAFWVPRHPESLQGLTTNVEFGRYVGSGRCVYGRPDGAPHTRYLDWLYDKLTGRRPHETLSAAMKAAVAAAGHPTG
ncbi:MAG TPA: nucleoside 2-deoxyribosyltransferase domain-containing protein [Fimbriiglobus sp.]|nr:nucleoside 2-deoxyribosyltransferase domain-containing protein [Fimbriiglobus sp.]